MTDFICNTCSHEEYCEIGNHVTAEEGCLSFLPEVAPQSPPASNFQTITLTGDQSTVLCDTCAYPDTCLLYGTLKPGQACTSGYAEGEPRPENERRRQVYAVDRVISRYQDLLADGLRDLSDELGGHNLAVDDVEVKISTHRARCLDKPKAQRIVEQLFDVSLTVKSRGHNK